MSDVKYGSAFPLPEYANNDGRRGMTKLEYVATQLYASLINAHYSVPNNNGTEATDEQVADIAVNQAKILLSRLDKERK